MCLIKIGTTIQKTTRTMDNIKDLNISHMCYGVTDSKEKKKFYLKQMKNILEDIEGSIDGILQREERNENEE